MYAFDVCIGITVKTPCVYTKLILRVPVNLAYSNILRKMGHFASVDPLCSRSRFHRVAVQQFIKRNPDSMPALITLLAN